MLVKAAAERWKVPESECKDEKGTVPHKKSGRSLSYGKLCLAAGKLEIPKEPSLKNESEFRYIGKAMPRVDIPEKVAGKAIFGLDVNVLDMLYAVIARPPAYGAKPISYDQKAAEGVKGVRTVFPADQGIFVCAESLTASAISGIPMLKLMFPSKRRIVGSVQKEPVKIREETGFTVGNPAIELDHGACQDW